jgi:hypothetical protein
VLAKQEEIAIVVPRGASLIAIRADSRGARFVGSKWKGPEFELRPSLSVLKAHHRDLEPRPSVLACMSLVCARARERVHPSLFLSLICFSRYEIQPHGIQPTHCSCQTLEVRCVVLRHHYHMCCCCCLFSVGALSQSSSA